MEDQSEQHRAETVAALRKLADMIERMSLDVPMVRAQVRAHGGTAQERLNSLSRFAAWIGQPLTIYVDGIGDLVGSVEQRWGTWPLHVTYTMYGTKLPEQLRPTTLVADLSNAIARDEQTFSNQPVMPAEDELGVCEWYDYCGLVCRNEATHLLALTARGTEETTNPETRVWKLCQAHGMYVASAPGDDVAQLIERSTL